MDRRSFLALGAKAAAGILFTQTVPALASSRPRAEEGVKNLAFYHTHTRECLDITYARNGVHDLKALCQINKYLRDFRTSEVHPIDPAILDILWQIQQEIGCRSTYEIISGYRSPKTNRRLRGKSAGVAKRSLHMNGQAVDIRLTGKNTRLVRDCAVALEQGGVGYYASSDFVHIDTGRFRVW
ncbi:YcbK family protein [Candidatus Electronema sp. TJ]|uniref:YcbK family protein n=1 Tax=Candidatus Electronema sp. TJ TaxID=3401573 RepID=UPI003AA7E4C3